MLTLSLSLFVCLFDFTSENENQMNSSREEHSHVTWNGICASIVVCYWRTAHIGIRLIIIFSMATMHSFMNFRKDIQTWWNVIELWKKESTSHISHISFIHPFVRGICCISPSEHTHTHIKCMCTFLHSPKTFRQKTFILALSLLLVLVFTLKWYTPSHSICRILSKMENAWTSSALLWPQAFSFSN